MPEGTARGFSVRDEAGNRLEVIIWHQGDTLVGFVNQCPHLGLPLETFPDRFLSADGTHLICSAHGAQFDAHGACFAGPCHGRALTPLVLAVETATQDETPASAKAPPQAIDKMPEAIDKVPEALNKVIVLKATPRHS
jgi:nitrite reductase/ring-hydroxylating ferredoxin subunit